MISPEYQRMFRWEPEQRSQFIESLLLGLPIPQIVIFQNEDGQYELIDGLQRVTTLIDFIEEEPKLTLNVERLKKLEGCDIITTLNGLSFKSLGSLAQLELKRRTLRAIVITRTNDPNLRYQMFKRLNSGGSPAEPQEIRNATIRIFGESGSNFLSFIERCSTSSGFATTTELLSDRSAERMGREELALRFVALKHARNDYKGHITSFLDHFAESIATGQRTINYSTEYTEFDYHFRILAEKFGNSAFLKHKDGRPIGGVAPAYFEAVSIGTLDSTDYLETVDSDTAKSYLAEAVDLRNSSFASNVGPGANSKQRLLARIKHISDHFESKKPH